MCVCVCVFFCILFLCLEYILMYTGRDIETMKIFQVSKEMLGFDSKSFTTALVVCLIALPVSIMVSMIYRNSKFEISPVSGGNAHSGVESEIHSAESAIFPTGKLLNGTLEPRINQESDSRNVSSKPTSKNADKLLNGNSNPELDKESGSRNDSPQAQPTRIADDKLLQGLVPPGILDEGSCLSRYQSILYRKLSSHKPSSYFHSKLREYEDLHKRCGPYTKSYNRTVRRLGASHTSRSTSGCKYIVWIPANGLGNRIISMAATFLYAILTNRVLLVDHEADMADLFCEPFPNSSWLLPRNFPLMQQFGVQKIRIAHSFGNMLKSGIINMSMDQSLPSHLYLNLDHSNYDLDKKLFYCDESEALLRKVDWLILLSDQYFAPYFFLSSTYKEEVSKLFPEKDTIFHHLGSYLFNPSNQAWGLITRFYDAYLAKADERVGLQIRVFAKTTPFQTVIDQIFACTQKEKLLPEIETQKSVASPSQSKSKTSKAILVTSLYSEFYGNLSNMYWTRPTMTGEIIGVFQPSHEEYQQFGNNMHNMKAWAEIYLLSLSDVLVTSAWSTFGYVAQGLGGLKPWILYKTDDKTIPNPPCRRDLSMEPCFHFPPTYDCQAKVKFDAGSLFPYLRHCEDLNWGVKLVTDRKEL
ncbi:probable fucosyltransferase 7 isoform X1 [Hevea brasiliensis]|uniref:probable fucosyltransferase 7 isoform X1 n=1 Tax=Hevea brasiliensis TaxID=3981 RepID=UPI0025FC6BEC|nr:probable fucosyltransferase 7 isoform X1 [Hevea brasiliensis]